MYFCLLESPFSIAQSWIFLTYKALSHSLNENVCSHYWSWPLKSNELATLKKHCHIKRCGAWMWWCYQLTNKKGFLMLHKQNSYGKPHICAVPPLVCLVSYFPPCGITGKILRCDWQLWSGYSRDSLLCEKADMQAAEGLKLAATSWTDSTGSHAAFVSVCSQRQSEGTAALVFGHIQTGCSRGAAGEVMDCHLYRTISTQNNLCVLSCFDIQIFDITLNLYFWRWFKRSFLLPTLFFTVLLVHLILVLVCLSFCNQWSKKSHTLCQPLPLGYLWWLH